MFLYRDLKKQILMICLKEKQYLCYLGVLSRRIWAMPIPPKGISWNVRLNWWGPATVVCQKYPLVLGQRQVIGWPLLSRWFSPTAIADAPIKTIWQHNREACQQSSHSVYGASCFLGIRRSFIFFCLGFSWRSC